MPPRAPSDRRRAYEIHQAFASGGMASVHLGRLLGPAGFSKRVAIKRLHSQLASDPEIAAAFAEEARLASRVTHANIAAILDVVSDDGEILLVMEYVHGETLARLLGESRRGGVRVPIPIVVSIMAAVLHGLHAAHEAVNERGEKMRLVHRDVSPQNVIVGTDGIARVVDFGIAKTMASAHLTRDGQLKGKLPYMAPEQLGRRAIDRRVDIWSAGVVLWEAVAGKRLFAAGDEATLFSDVLEKRITPPSHEAPDVGRALEAVVMRALERDPERRFATAEEMATALEASSPRAGASAVADWVAATAREALAKRDASIASMEAGEPASDARDQIRARQVSIIFREGAAPDRHPPTTLAVDTDAARVAPPRRRIAAIAAVAALALLVIAGAALASSRTGPIAPIGKLAPSLAFAHATAFATPDLAPAPAPNLTQSGGFAPPAQPSQGGAAGADPTGELRSPLSRPPAPAPAPAPAPIAHRAPPMQWCKVFDPDKRIFVMKAMRTARCP